MTKRMYVLVNEDLKMSRGKVAAQVAHAVARLYTHFNIKDEAETCIVLEATAEQIRNLETYLDRKGIGNYTYIDEGVNEIPAYSITAMAIEPLEEVHTEWGSSPTELDTSGLQLLRNNPNKARKWWE